MKRLTAFGMAMAAMGGYFATAEAQVTLVHGGEAQAVIVLADMPTETAQYAAEELVDHVERATGVRLDVVPESEAPEAPHTRVYLGPTETALRHGIDADTLPREAYVMRSVGNDLFIVGREDDGDPLSPTNPNVGTLFGVYGFLESVVGVRWLWPGELGTYVPETDTIVLNAAKNLEAPKLLFREMHWGRMRNIATGNGQLDPMDARLGFSPEGAEAYAKALEVFLRRHRMGGMDARPPVGHTVTGWWHKYGAEHPEWFLMRRDGERGRSDPEQQHVEVCVTNEELQDFIIDQWDGGPVLRLGAVDRPGRCNCEKCRAWDGPQPDPVPWFVRRVYETDSRAQEVFAGATSDRYARYWLTMQEKAEKRNPNVLVSASFLFENEFPAPVTDIKLNNRIYAEFVQWQDPHIRYFPVPDEALEWLKDQWTGWQRTGIRLGYRPNYLHDGYVLPHFETWQSADFFKFAYEHGMEGAAFDSLTGQWATQGLRLYIHFRLMADPELDTAAIRDEYFAAFGPAAPAIERYFDYWENYSREHLLRIIELYWNRGWRYSSYVRFAHEAFPPEAFDPAAAILAEAEAAAADADTEYADRVAFVRTGFDHAQLALRLTNLYNGEEVVPAGRRDEAKAALQELVAFRKAHERTFFSDLQHATTFWERPRMNLDELIMEIDGLSNN